MASPIRILSTLEASLPEVSIPSNRPSMHSCGPARNSMASIGCELTPQWLRPQAHCGSGISSLGPVAREVFESGAGDYLGGDRFRAPEFLICMCERFEVAFGPIVHDPSGGCLNRSLLPTRTPLLPNTTRLLRSRPSLVRSSVIKLPVKDPSLPVPSDSPWLS
jgi:hypothetical protein